MNFKYTIIYTFLSLYLCWLIVKYGSNLCNLKEGLTDFETKSHNIPYPEGSLTNYNNTNSPLYSHTVNLPINDTVSCKNFCGPQSQCAITREQCTSDIDCNGCNPGPPPINTYITTNVDPYDNAGGKLGHSNLTSGYNNHSANFSQIYPGSIEAELKTPYQGLDLWTKSFNEGLNLYNKRRESAEKYNQGITNQLSSEYEHKYPMRVSATGQFYETTPPPSNAYLQT